MEELKILLKLPVRSLLRCRCVSKSWKCLIDSDQFIKHHLDHSKKKSNNTNLTLIANFDLLIQTDQVTFKRVRHPFLYRSKPCLLDPVILGSCDGLLALKKYNEDGEIILWNPSIQRFNKVPYTPFEVPEEWSSSRLQNIAYGFGYDAVSNDYKLVRMVMYLHIAASELEVKIYSLKSNSWRRKPNFPYKVRSYHGVFVDGALHWIVIRKDTDTRRLTLVLAAYDLGTEEVRLVPFPDIGGNDAKVLTSLGGCLCLVYRARNDFRHHEVWVMKEYGVKESWSVLFTVESFGVDHIWRIAYSRCGRKVLLVMNDRKLVWYDLDTKSTYSPVVDAPSYCCSRTMSTCLRTLVLLNSGTCHSERFTEEKQRKGNKTSWTPRKDCPTMTNNRTGVVPAKGRPPWR